MRRNVRLQLVAVREDGASKVLSYSPDTLRVYLIVRKTLASVAAELQSASRSDSDGPWVSVRFSRAGLNRLPGS